MRNRPTPAAPRSRQPATSPPNSMLPQSSTRQPSRVSSGRSAWRASTWNRADRSAASAAIALLRLVVGVEDRPGPGRRRRWPSGSGGRGPARCPGRRRPGSPARPRRSRCGWPGRRPRWRSRGRGAGSSPAASLGVRSCASTIVGAARPSWNGSGRPPISWPRIRPSMSRTSAARAARWEPASRSSRAA